MSSNLTRGTHFEFVSDLGSSIAFVYSEHTRDQARALRRSGATWTSVSASLGVSVSTLIGWSRDPGSLARRRAACARCGSAVLDENAYAALLGYYLGDGHLARGKSCHALRISCDMTYPAIVDDVTSCIQAVHPAGRVFNVRRTGCINVQSQWQHWPCLFPQHGPGPKHMRPIVLEEWQQSIVEEHPGPFLRGLMHSDGSRVKNWARRPVAGEPKTYAYPPWQFVNASADIRRDPTSEGRSVRAMARRRREGGL